MPRNRLCLAVSLLVLIAAVGLLVSASPAESAVDSTPSATATGSVIGLSEPAGLGMLALGVSALFVRRSKEHL